MAESTKSLQKTPAQGRPIPKPGLRNLGLIQLARYRLPLAGKVSILHRVSGLLLFLSLPFLLYLFEQSLKSEPSFLRLKGLLAHVWIKGVVLVLVWAFLLHFFAGLRHVALDFHLAGSKRAGARTAAGVLLLSTGLTIVIVLKSFGVF
jgi:succinate dehydrogenase / fumarate reductase cytochrome b subunit